MFNAILYVLRTGCSWRMLPHDFPPWQAEQEYQEIWRQPNTDTAEMIQSLRCFLHEYDMMGNRLLELHRVLKSTGSLYLKLVLDAAFGAQSFCNEIIWKRTNS